MDQTKKEKQPKGGFSLKKSIISSHQESKNGLMQGVVAVDLPKTGRLSGKSASCEYARCELWKSPRLVEHQCQNNNAGDRKSDGKAQARRQNSGRQSFLIRSSKPKRKEDAQQTFMGSSNMWPAFIEGRHHKIMAEAFERIARGDLKRLIINMPPRH